MEAYLNSPGPYGERGGGIFPDRSRMSGEYYVGDEAYTGHVLPVCHFEAAGPPVAITVRPPRPAARGGAGARSSVVSG